LNTSYTRQMRSAPIEISGEFYPNSDAATDACGEPSSRQSEKDEQLARICELARRLGYNDAKAKMLNGQSADNLPKIERKLLNELHEQPDNVRQANDDNKSSMKQLREEKAQESPCVAESAQPSRQANSEPVHGFLFQLASEDLCSNVTAADHVYGFSSLAEAGIQIGLFPNDLMQELLALNKQWSDSRREEPVTPPPNHSSPIAYVSYYRFSDCWYISSAEILLLTPDTNGRILPSAVYRRHGFGR
jgi:hypothetical protein